MDTQAAANGPSGQPHAPTRQSTNWFTPLGGTHDHAVTDEAFIRRPELTAVCGDEFLLAPMTCPNLLCCPRCAAILDGRAYRDDTRYANRASSIRVTLPRLLHPIRWFGVRFQRERSHPGLSWLLSDPPVPAQRDRSQTSVTAMSVRRAASGDVATSVSGPVPGTDVSPQSSIAVSTPATDDAVPTRSAGSARHARGRDGSKPLVAPSPPGSRYPVHDQDRPVEAASLRAGCLHQDHEMPGAHRAKVRPDTAATTGAAPPDAPVVGDGADDRGV